MFVEIVILWLTRYKAEPRCVQKTGGLAIFAHCIYHRWTFFENYAGNYVIICESFQIMLPGGETVVVFCGRILALGTWNLQMSWCKCAGVPRGQPPPGWPLIIASALRQRDWRRANARNVRWSNFNAVVNTKLDVIVAAILNFYSSRTLGRERNFY